MIALTVVKVDSNTTIKPFDCGDKQLNDFLINSSKAYLNQRLSTTYLIEDDERTIAYFSIFNDSVQLEDCLFASRSELKRFVSGIVPHPKRHLNSFPAIKIGRLAVCKQVQTQGLGTAIIDLIIDTAIKQNQTCACRLLSVDAYAQSLGFYEKMKFEYFTNKDDKKDIYKMYFDLRPIFNVA